jgi:hypothetical protein
VGFIPDEVIGFSVYLILPAALCPCGQLSLQQEMCTGNLPGAKNRPAPNTICYPNIIIPRYNTLHIILLYAYIYYINYT